MTESETEAPVFEVCACVVLGRVRLPGVCSICGHPTTTAGAPDDSRLPGSDHTIGELRDAIEKMRNINDGFYWTCFHAGIGSTAHAFLEFCGLQSAYIQMCSRMLDRGIDFSSANVHGSVSPDMPAHSVIYLAEKFECIYGHAIGRDPKLSALFVKAALGRELKDAP